jgi:translation initiation factor 1
VERRYNPGSMDDILNELDAEKATVIISKDMRKFNKPVTIVQGFQNYKADDIRSITKRLKNRIGTGGTFKEGKIILHRNHKEAVVKLLIENGFDEKVIVVL